jgi:hypothetical protein
MISALVYRKQRLSELGLRTLMRGTVKLRILREGQEYFASKRQYWKMKEAFTTMAIKHSTKHNQRLAMLHFINN